MKQSLLSLIAIISTTTLFSQQAREVGVEIQVSLNNSNDLVLNWFQQNGSTKYEVYTKGSDDLSWDKLAEVDGSITTFTDTSYVVGTRKEYRVARSSTSYSFQGNGYILAGFDVPAKESWGRVLMVIEDKYQSAAVAEVQEYIDQIKNEGYLVDTHYVNAMDDPSQVKAWIKNNWEKDKSTFTMVFLLGRVPVPYSGDMRPDGHTDHTGAWPADMYFGSFSVDWTDKTVNTTSASRAVNRNVPGDGKFDLSRLNSSKKSKIDYVELPVGRVDLTNMPAFGDDTTLIKRYLKKSMLHRTGKRVTERRAVIDDNFGYFNSESFASGGFRNFATYVGDSIYQADYRSSMSAKSYLWSYGCGPGTYTSASGVATSNNFANDSLLNPFTMLFGSYFGDWDNSNNLLRAPLASKGWGLASMWAGRPYWMVHSSAHGAPLAQSTLHTYNTWNVYNAAAFMSGVHTALMGDPTLRTIVVENIDSVSAIADCDRNILLSWPAMDVDSMVVDHLDTSGKWMGRMVVDIDSSISMKDQKYGNHTFRLRGLKKLSSASGTWWEYSAAKEANVFVDTVPFGNIEGIQPRLCPGITYKLVDLGDFDSTVTTEINWNGITKQTYYLDSFEIYSDIDTTMKVYLRRTSADGCSSFDSLIAFFKNPPVPKIIVQENMGRIGDTVTLATSPSFSSYRWNNEDGTDSFIYRFVAKNETEVNFVEATDYLGCTPDTAQITLYFVPNSKEILLSMGIKVFPNPISNELKISLNKPVKSLKVTIYDNIGKIVLTDSYINQIKEATLDVSALKAGTYYMNLESEGVRTTTTLIKP
jgi:hypothetical protein